jgi:hypothetical protein
MQAGLGVPVNHASCSAGRAANWWHVRSLRSAFFAVDSLLFILRIDHDDHGSACSLFSIRRHTGRDLVLARLKGGF